MKAVILDRDGVINVDRDGPIVQPDDWEPIPGSLEAIGRLSQAGIPVAVATNQSGLARGLLELDTLHAIHRRMLDAIGKQGGRIETIAFCPHAESSDCECRKPAPGMLYSIADRFDVELTDVVLIGDSLRDIQAALAAQTQAMIVRTGKGQQTLDNNKGLEHVPAFDDLAACVDAVLHDIEAQRAEKPARARGQA